MGLQIVIADFRRPDHVEGFLDALDSYARDPIGGGEALRSDVRDRLPAELLAMESSLVLLAMVEGRVVGTATCFLGYSTFAARPLLNIHDLAVLPDQRGKGVGQELLAAVDEEAKKRGCCKVTLEVREDNAGARALYERVGYTDYVQAGQQIRTLFLEKRL